MFPIMACEVKPIHATPKSNPTKTLCPTTTRLNTYHPKPQFSKPKPKPPLSFRSESKHSHSYPLDQNFTQPSHAISRNARQKIYSPFQQSPPLSSSDLRTRLNPTLIQCSSTRRFQIRVQHQRSITLTSRTFPSRHSPSTTSKRKENYTRICESATETNFGFGMFDFCMGLLVITLHLLFVSSV